MMVGDGLHDVQAGNAAGVITCLLEHEWNSNAVDKADYVINNLSEIEDIIKKHGD